MNKKAKASRWFVLPMVGLLCLMLGSCKEESAKCSTLHLSMEDQKIIERSMLPEDTPLEVSRYTVEGEGPQGTTFSVMSNTKAIEVEGLLVGSWTIHAVGQNSQGVDLVEGNTTVTLTQQPTEAIIELASLSGKGEMVISVSWDPVKISSPSVELSLTDSEGNTRALVPTVNNLSGGSVTYSGTYDAGSYLFQAKLSSGTIAVAGCAEVVRVVGNRTTEGTISLSLDKYADVPTSLTLIDKLGLPVVCTIEGITSTMVAHKPATASLVTNDEQTIEVNWYLDGQLISSAGECTFTPSSGSHRLDVIAEGALLASSGSASISFTATVEGTSGVPVLVSTVEDTADGLHIGLGARVAFLPDGKILLASNQHQTLQVCRIVRDSLEVVHTYSAIDGFNTVDMLELFVDQATYRVAVSDAHTPSLTIYQYDISTSSLTKLFTRGNVYFEDGTKTFTSLQHLALDKVSGMLYGLIPDATHVVKTYLYANSASEVNPNQYAWWLKAYDRFEDLAIAPGGKYAALVEATSGLLKICSKNSTQNLFSNDQNFTSADGSTPYLDNISSVTFLNDDNVIFGTDNDVGRFTLSGETWTQSDIFSSEQYDVGPMEGAKTLCHNLSGTLLYVLSSGSRNITTFSASSPTFELAYLETTNLGDYQPVDMELSPKQDHLAVVSDTNTALMLFMIP